MIQEITRKLATRIKNPVFRDYANMYLDIYEDFIFQSEHIGLPFHKNLNQAEESRKLIQELKSLGVTIRCNGASLVYNHLSSACEACKNGIGTMTSYISFQCHRNCFFCFNPNQENFEAYFNRKNNWSSELEQIKNQGGILTHIALTGGEPLLYSDDTIAFFKKSKELFPAAHRRLYTSGDLLTEDILKNLQQTGLEEIRFSYKIEDDKSLKEKILHQMDLAKFYIPTVIVEMPVMPDSEEEMKSLLKCLDHMGIFGINLLELGFPYYNQGAFSAKGYQLKYPPYQTLYNFSYAGGLPIAGSEVIALRLLRYAVKEKLNLGIHYCSLENKNFGQLYQQNYPFATENTTMYFSKKDYYLKTIKAFGADAAEVYQIFKKAGIDRYLYDKKNKFIQFHPGDAYLLKGRSIELAVSVNVMEERNSEIVTRELKLLRAFIEDCRPENL